MSQESKATNLNNACEAEAERMCGSCGKTLPVSMFYKDGTDNAGNVRYRRDCKDCYKVTRIREADMKRKVSKR